MYPEGAGGGEGRRAEWRGKAQNLEERCGRGEVVVLDVKVGVWSREWGLWPQ
jgi:hypothetical protein